MIPLITTIIFCTVLIVSCLSALHKDLTDINENLVYFLTGFYIINFDEFEKEEENESE